MEAALAIATLVLVLVLCLAGVTAVSMQVRCIDAAREAARLAARGDVRSATDVARSIAPRAALVQVHRDGEFVVATVTAHSNLLPCGAVVAVIGGRGGAGASLFAVALAQAAADALLVDLDPWAGGIDLLVGGETAPGLRWPDLALQGGRLNWSAVRAALPRPRGISVLSGTRRGYELDAGPVDAVIDAGRRGGVTVVCDLPRRLTDATQAALDAADLVVLVSPCDVRACAAAATMAPVLTAINPNLGLVVRGPSPGGLRAAEVADVAGVPLLASMRAQPRLAEQLEHGGLRLRRRSVLASAARRVLGVLPRAGSGRHGRAA